MHTFINEFEQASGFSGISMILMPGPETKSLIYFERVPQI